MEETPLQFPVRGIDLARAFARQTGETTARAVNVRAFDPLEDRHRGGSRDGLTRWIDAALPAEIQGIGAVASTGEEFVIGYYPFHWPGFIVNPTNYAPVRPGGSGEPQLPGLVPTLAWTPDKSALYEDEAFAVGELDATATDPRDLSSLAGTFSYDPAAGTLFGHVATRTVTVTFTPTDTATFRKAQTTYTFHRKKTLTYVDWSPTTSVAVNTVLDGAILTAAGKNKDDDTSVAGTVTYDLFGPDGLAIAPADGATLDQADVEYTIVALFTPTNATRYESSTKTVVFTTDAAAGGPPYTFTARDIFHGFVFNLAASTVDVRDSANVIVDSVPFSEIKPSLYTFLVAGGYTSGSPWAGPLTMTVGDYNAIDGGGTGTWHYP